MTTDLAMSTPRQHKRGQRSVTILVGSATERRPISPAYAGKRRTKCPPPGPCLDIKKPTNTPITNMVNGSMRDLLSSAPNIGEEKREHTTWGLSRENCVQNAEYLRFIKKNVFVRGMSSAGGNHVCNVMTHPPQTMTRRPTIWCGLGYIMPSDRTANDGIDTAIPRSDRPASSYPSPSRPAYRRRV